jgi:predicted nucleic acid-binding Zn finger protein
MERSTHSARVRRSATDGILLLRHERDASVGDDDALLRFFVQGGSGAQYEVAVHRTITCSCPDFQNRRRKCKHILFVMARVLRLSQAELEDLGPDVVMDAETRARLHERATSAEERRTVPRPSHREPDTECGICCEVFAHTSVVRDCTTCWHTAHQACLRAWTLAMRRDSRSCPYCRGESMGVEPRLFAPPGGVGGHAVDPPHAPLQLERMPRQTRDDDVPCLLPPGL